MRPTEGPLRYRVLRPGLGERPRLTAVFNFRDNPSLHFIRLDDMLLNKHLSKNELINRLNLDAGLWNLDKGPDFFKDSELRRFRNYPAGGERAGPAGSAVGAGAAAVGRAGPSGPAVWGGWAAGALLLVLLVLFVRAAEKCVDTRLFKSRRRRRSQEWPHASVAATGGLQQNFDLDPFSNLEESEFSTSSQRNSDLPPPYSECASNNDVISNTIVKNFNTPNTEEPPPPYSACLVSFFNKDIPSVHIHRRQTNESQTSSDVDNAHNDLIERHQLIETAESNNPDDIMRVELVFDNGRVVERTIDIESTSDNVPDIVTHVGHVVIGNGNADHITCTEENDHQHEVVLV